MTSENKPLSLASKLAKIGKEIGAVKKSGKNVQQRYDYIEYGVVAGKIRELFDEYQIIIIPNVDNIQQDEITSKYDTKGYHYILQMTFTLINGENPEDREIASWCGEASDFGDKGINKAETSGTKYFLMRLFNISEKGENEADAESPEMKTTRAKSIFSKQALAEAKINLSMAGSIEELKNIYKGLGAIAREPEIIKLKDEMKEKLGNDSE